MTLYWTHAQPTVAGWYWTRQKTDDADEGEIRYVSFFNSSMSVEAADTTIDADEIEWWAGPIPRPIDLR